MTNDKRRDSDSDSDFFEWSSNGSSNEGANGDGKSRKRAPKRAKPAVKKRTVTKKTSVSQGKPRVLANQFPPLGIFSHRRSVTEDISIWFQGYVDWDHMVLVPVKEPLTLGYIRDHTERFTRPETWESMAGKEVPLRRPENTVSTISRTRSRSKSQTPTKPPLHVFIRPIYTQYGYMDKWTERTPFVSFFVESIVVPKDMLDMMGQIPRVLLTAFEQQMKKYRRGTGKALVRRSRM